MRHLGLSSSILALMLVASSAMGQVVTATLYGTVLDPQGAIVASATVTALNVGRGTSLSRQSNELGEASFPSLPVGEYAITIEAKGFKTLKRSGITLSAGQDLRMSFTLEVGQIAETIEVTGEAPLVNTSNAEQRSNLESARVQELPISRRDWTNLLSLATGVQVSGGAVRLNGLAPSSFRLTVDGTDATQDSELPSFAMSGNFNFIKGVSTEAISEVNVAKGIASAEIANTMSGNVNIITKSGTNQIHGSAFWLNNTENLNARQQFLRTKPGVVYNQFGGSLGGPAIKNKLFFFGAFDGYRLRGFQALNGQVPTKEFKARVGAATKIYDKMFSVFPEPNQPYAATANTGGWVGSGSEQGNDNHAVIRGDYYITSPTILTARYTRARPFRLTPAVVTANYRTWQGTVEQGSMNITHARPTWTFETRFGVNYNRVPRLDAYYNLFAADSSYNGIGGLGFSINGEINAREGYTYSIEESVAKSLGRHSLKFGGLFMKSHVRRFNVSTANLTYNSIDDLLNNIPNAGEVNLGVREFDLRDSTLGFFVQDDLKVSQRLVINMGVRWDYFSIPKERDKRLFNRAQPFGTGPYVDPDRIWEPDYNNFSPRLGFAYQLRPNGKSVLRGGGGMFHSPIPLYAGPVDLVRDAVDEPFRVNYSRSDVAPAGNIFRWPVSNDKVRPYIKSRPTLIGDTAVNTNLPAPFSYQWNLGIQHEFPGGIALDTAYVGTRGVHLHLIRFMNQVDRITGIRPYSGFTQFRYRDPDENTVYHSWQSAVRKRFSSGFSIGGSYTYASAYSYTGSADIQLGTAVQDAYNIRADKGPPNEYVRHYFVSDVIYELPLRKLSGSNSLPMRNLLHGWQISGVLPAQTGNPLNITQSTAFEGSRADYVGGEAKLSGYRETLRYLNPSSFALVPIGQQSGAPIRPGNVGRNALMDIGRWNLDMALAKKFVITEKLHGKLEAQMLNSLNHTNLSGVASSRNAANFGMFTSTRGARVVQMNLRLEF